MSTLHETNSTQCTLTKCEVDGYAKFGIDSPYVTWGCHPEVDAYKIERENEAKNFLYIGGFMSTRKPTATTARAFRNVKNPSIELTIKTQRPVEKTDFIIPDSISDLSGKAKKLLADDSDARLDERIKIVEKDMTHDEYLRRFAEWDTSVAPSRWEGLGLNLFEAQSLGIPTISCYILPINEVIEHGKNGLLVECRPIGRRKNGLMAYEPTVESMQSAITALSDRGY